MKHEGAFMAAIMLGVALGFAVLIWNMSGGIGQSCNRDGTCDSAALACVKKVEPLRFVCEPKPEVPE